jgi:hypothetical protein
MKYALETGKVINIPDTYISKNMHNLGITRQEAVDMYLSDEGITVDTEILTLTEKAKAAGTGAKATGEKIVRKAPERKPDDVKRAIIAGLAEYVGDIPGVSTSEVTNIERMIAFEFAGDKYEITLTKKRAPKK